MRTIQETLTGNYTFAGSGRYFRILSTTGLLDISFFQRGSLKEQALQVGAGFWSRFEDPFDRIDIAGTGTVKFAVSEVEGGWDRVSIDGAVTVAQAGTLVEGTVATVAGVATLAAASANRKRLVFYHASGATGPIYIGGSPALNTFAPIVLQPGDMWIERDAAAAAWYVYAISAGFNVRVQEAF